MSYDLIVSYFSKINTVEKAKVVYEGFNEQEFSFANHSSISNFYDELVAKYPELSSLSDESDGDIDLCPWSDQIYRTSDALILSCVFSKAEDVYKTVLELAVRHGLTVFDPQSGVLTTP